MRLPRYLFVLIGLLAWNLAAAVEIQTWRSDNGVPVYFIESHDLPIVDMRLSFRAAASRDGDLPGLSSLVNGLLVEGSGDLDANQVALVFEREGARIGHRSGRDMAWTGLRSLSDSERLDSVVDMLGRLTALPSFPREALERDRASLLASLAERQQRIGTIAGDALYQAMYPGHPYRHGGAGTRESLQAITLEDVVGFHRRYYVASNASLAIVGDLSAARARHYANQVTRHLAIGQPAAELPLPGSPARRSLFIEHPGDQSRIRIGMPLLARHDPDYYILALGNHILGGNGSHSRLMREIRERRGLSYDVYSYLLPLESVGPFEIGLQTRSHQVTEVLELIDEIVRRFIAEGPDPAELEQARRNIIGGFPLRLDSNLKLLEQLAMIGFYNLPLDYLDSYRRRIAGVSAGDIRRVFRQRLRPEHMIRVIVGPATGPTP